jgi:hypothetical protein
VLSVDLWDGPGEVEQNLVMHPSTTSVAALAGHITSPPMNRSSGYPHQSWGASHAPPIDNGHYHPPAEYAPQSGYLYENSSNYQPGYSGYNPASNSMHHFNQHDEYSGPPPQGGGQHFTRNLIGSLTASAFRLKDDKDQIGIWFVLQDLSVRTEGQFRLKFSFLNLGRYPSYYTPLTFLCLFKLPFSVLLIWIVLLKMAITADQG